METITPNTTQAADAKAIHGMQTYIRPLEMNEGGGFAICSNGKILAQFPSYHAAYYTARQFRLTPQLVH